MRHDTTHEPTRSLLDEVRAAFEAEEPPAPRPELLTMFATGLTTDNGDLLATAASNAHGSALQTAGLPNWTGRRNTMVKDLMSHVRTRMAAAVLGATAAMAGMGAAGALNAPIQFVSSFGDDTEACASAPADEGAETDLGEDEATSCDERSDDEGGSDDVDAVDPASESDDSVATEIPEAPTTASEAAHIHEFDEACGNHGAYVSHVARFGEEPECATNARSGVEQDDAAEDDKHSGKADENDAEHDVDDGDEPQSSRSSNGRDKQQD